MSGFNSYSGNIQQQQYGYNQPTSAQLVSNLIGNGAVSLVWEAQRSHAGMYYSHQGNLCHKYVDNGAWAEEILAKNIYGDVSSVYEPQRSHAAFFYKGQDGYLKYTYFNGSAWATSDCYQKGGKVGGRICTVFETHRTHSACFFVGEDAKIHYFYVENGAWQYWCFGDAPCTGDLSAVYEPQRNSSAFVYESYGQIQYNYFNGQQWTKDATTFVEPCTGAISIVFEKQRNHTAIFYASKGDVVYYYVDQMWKCSKNLFQPEVIGDIAVIFNDATQHSELLYVTKGGIQHYFVQNSAWSSIAHQVDCISTLDAIYQPSRKAAEFFYVSSNGKTNYGYLNGNNFSFSYW
eukprot:gene11057-3765_t